MKSEARPGWPETGRAARFDSSTRNNAKGEKPFTPVICKSQRKKKWDGEKQLARNEWQPYNTRSRGVTAH
ncbi:hypothetical protein A2U01_0056918, partial [Trifolium medium]|nr:hypothetical protein [Trifolium medium]